MYLAISNTCPHRSLAGVTSVVDVVGAGIPIGASYAWKTLVNGVCKSLAVGAGGGFNINSEVIASNAEITALLKRVIYGLTFSVRG